MHADKVEEQSKAKKTASISYSDARASWPVGIGIDSWVALLIAGIVSGLTLVWFSFDHRFPTQDEANHILSSIAFKDLLTHCRPWQGQWWYNVWSINVFYPPFIYFINGLFLLAGGQSRFVEQLCMAFFTGLMVLAVYAVVRLLGGARVTALAAGICLCMYPAVSELSHTYFLDLPVVSMTAFALMVLLWWRNDSEAKLLRALLTGLVFGAACLSKQIVAAYLIPVGMYFFTCDLISTFKGRQNGTDKSHLVWLFQTIGVGLVAILVGLPFILVNYQSSRSYLDRNIQAFACKGIHLSSADKLTLYCHQLPWAMTPVLFALFIISLLVLKRREYIRIMPIIVSALGGLCITIACPGIGTDFRYYAASLIAPAIFSGFLLEKLIASKSHWWQAVVVFIVAIATGNYITNNFSPYPLTLPEQISRFLRTTGLDNPVPIADWGHQFVIDTIMKVDSDKIVFLNILPNQEALHIHAFELLLKEQGNETIRVSGSRAYTIVGDQVKFTPEEALGYHWYLCKTGSPGFYFYDKQSEDNFRRLVDFVRKSGNYRLMAQKKLPDGTELMLYRRRF